MKTHLLIDGDIVAFVSAAAAQAILVDDFGWSQPFANTKMGEALVENMLYAMKLELKADSFEIILSDPKDNWRKAVDPHYKDLRHEPFPGASRPILLPYLKDYLREKYAAYHWDSLEADDTLGVLATDPKTTSRPETIQDATQGYLVPYRRVIVVGRDKDFKSIPGLHHSWKQDLDANGRMIVREVSQWEADRFHLVQALAGDRVDGIAGCPGIAMERAAKIIDDPVRLVPEEGVKTRGVNKGDAVMRWFAEPTLDYWACIVSHYRKAGLTEEDALRNARLVRILRHGEYNRETEELRLWTPDMIPTRS